MAQTVCPTCKRSNGDFEPRRGLVKTYDVRLSSFHNLILSCSLCAFVQRLLEQDPATPRLDDSKYEDSMIRIDEWGLRFTGQWQGALVIELYKSGGQPKLPIPRNIPSDLDCDLAAEIIKDWLKSCEAHEECSKQKPVSIERENAREPGFDHGAQDGSRPKRLIFLDQHLEGARLVPYPVGSAVPYAALSYCWGGNGTFKTEAKSLKAFEENIPLEQVPQTLRDAFSLTNKIGLNYLWIDAICIVQGNQLEERQEWEQESKKMGRIYSNAKIVLAATRTLNVHEGIFQPRPKIPLSNDIETPSICARRNLNHEIITSCRTKSDKWWETNINGTFPLLSRGWGFQERMLATRLVHFTPTEMVWECQNTRKCECRVVESHLYAELNNMLAALRTFLSKPFDEMAKRQMWRELVRSYSVRKLTHIDDKLPALSGIAELFKEKSGDQYAAGLWRNSLPFDLLWRCDQSGNLKDRKTRSPSWSWISVDGAIKWPVSQQPYSHTSLDYISSTTYFEGGSEGIETCDVSCALDGLNEFGRVKSGRIKLKTRLVPANVHKVSKAEWSDLFGTKWAIEVKGSDPAPFWPDITEKGLYGSSMSNEASKMVYVMEIMQPGNGTGSWEETLAVRLIDGSVADYERVGVSANVIADDLGQWTTRRGWFKDSHFCDINLF